MRKMKDSGIEWIGEIPEKWSIGKTLYALTMPITDGPHEAPELFDEGIPFVSAEAVSFGNGKIDFNHIRGFISKQYYDECCKKYIPKEKDIYMIKSGATTGKVAVVDTDIIFTIWSPLAVFRANEDIMNYKYLFYFMQSFAFQKQIEINWSYGTQQNIGMRTLEKLMLCFPSVTEQKCISAFLDKKTFAIDAIIKNIKTQIEKLKAYKQSLITEVVTKGLNPDVELQKVKCEYIDKVPINWKVSRMKYVTTVVRGASPRPIDEYMTSSEQGENWIKIGDTHKGNKYITETKQFVTHEGADKSRRVYKGDLILSNSMSFGEPYILGIDGCIHDGWLALTELKGVVVDYLYYFLQSSFCNIQFNKQVAGGIVQNLNSEKVEACIIFCPILEEQNNIAAYLDKKCATIDKLLELKQQKIDKLNQYKKSLIYEYVTGKKEAV